MRTATTTAASGIAPAGDSAVFDVEPAVLGVAHQLGVAEDLIIVVDAQDPHPRARGE